jgi:hypothetical protein
MNFTSNLKLDSTTAAATDNDVYGGGATPTSGTDPRETSGADELKTNSVETNGAGQLANASPSAGDHGDSNRGEGAGLLATALCIDVDIEVVGSATKRGSDALALALPPNKKAVRHDDGVVVAEAQHDGDVENDVPDDSDYETARGDATDSRHSTDDNVSESQPDEESLSILGDRRDAPLRRKAAVAASERLLVVQHVAGQLHASVLPPKKKAASVEQGATASDRFVYVINDINPSYKHTLSLVTEAVVRELPSFVQWGDEPKTVVARLTAKVLESTTCYSNGTWWVCSPNQHQSWTWSRLKSGQPIAAFLQLAMKRALENAIGNVDDEDEAALARCCVAPLSDRKVSISGLTKLVAENLNDPSFAQTPRDRNLTPFEDVVFDSSTHITRPARPNDYVFAHTGYALEPSKPNTLDEQRALDDLLRMLLVGASNDGDLYQFILAMVAMLLVGQSLAVQHLFLVIGSGGNMKTMLTKVVRVLLGARVAALSEDTLCKSHPAGKPRADLDPLRRAAVAICDDMTADMLSGSVRQVTGGGEVTYRMLHARAHVDTTLHAQFLVTANRGRQIVPDLDDTQSLRRRVFVVELTTTFVAAADYHARESSRTAPRANPDDVADLICRARAPLARLLLGMLPDIQRRFSSTGMYLPRCAAVQRAADAFFQKRTLPHEAWYRAARATDGNRLPLLFLAPLPPPGEDLAAFALGAEETKARPRPDSGSLFTAYKAYRDEHFPEEPKRTRGPREAFGRAHLVAFLTAEGVAFAKDSKGTQRALNFLLRDKLSPSQQEAEWLSYQAERGPVASPVDK